MKRKRLYYTRYGRGRFTSHVWARDLSEAADAIDLRGLGEKLIARAETDAPVSPFDQRASNIMSKAHYETEYAHEYYDAIHALTFLAHLATSSGVASPAEFLADEGLIHEWIHLGAGLTKRPAKLRADLLRRVKAIEKRVPGYVP